MQSVNISEKCLGLLANFVGSWPGAKIGRRGLIAVENERGSKPPLVWVFNGAHEFPALAAALGPDQPLIGLRSLNTVVRIDKLITWDERVLAGIYVEELRAYLGMRPFFIGGNCQGATIAAAMAREFLLSGCPIRGFAAMEWVDLPPLPLASTLMFGAESELHNPFLRNIDPRPMWSRIYPRHNIAILPGRHATYFSPESIPVLVGHLRGALAAEPIAPAVPRRAARLTGLPASANEKADLTVGISPLDDLAGDDIVFLWDSHFSCLPHRQIERICADEDGGNLARTTAPITPGLWTLQTFRCRPGEGPVAWADETQVFHQLQILDDGATP